MQFLSTRHCASLFQFNPATLRSQDPRRSFLRLLIAIRVPPLAICRHLIFAIFSARQPYKVINFLWRASFRSLIVSILSCFFVCIQGLLSPYFPGQLKVYFFLTTQGPWFTNMCEYWQHILGKPVFKVSWNNWFTHYAIPSSSILLSVCRTRV